MIYAAPFLSRGNFSALVMTQQVSSGAAVFVLCGLSSEAGRRKFHLGYYLAGDWGRLLAHCNCDFDRRVRHHLGTQCFSWFVLLEDHAAIRIDRNVHEGAVIFTGYALGIALNGYRKFAGLHLARL
jgi:hypothetical protein